jgi:murein tripeptide amidase MpaA
MTVSSEQSRVQYATDGVATSFPVPFRVLQNRDTRVTLVDSEGNEQELSLNTDWVSGFAACYEQYGDLASDAAVWADRVNGLQDWARMVVGVK